MTTVALVKQRLAEAVQVAGISWTVDGRTTRLSTYSFMPAAPDKPCFAVGEVLIRPNNNFRSSAGASGADVLIVTCCVFVGDAEDRDGQLLLDQLLSNEGTLSVRNALLAARGLPGQPALSGAADDLVIDEVNGYGQVQAGANESYYGANIIVRVIGS